MLIYIAAVIAFTACSKTVSTFVGEKEEISFSTINSVYTKAPSSSPLAEEADLGVFAHNVTEDKTEFENSQFSKSDGAWKATPPKYWPDNNTLRFTIYSPYQSKDIDIRNGEIKTEVPANLDFLYGQKVYEGKRDIGKIKVLLKHSKSVVRFNVFCDLDNTVKVNAISLTNAATTGEISIKYNETNTDPQIAWKRSPELGTVGIEGISDFQVTCDTLQCGKDLLIIPGDSNGTISKGELNIDYTIGESKISKNVKLKGDWLKGKRYIYNVRFTTNEILFDAEVENWDEVNEDFEIKDHESKKE